MVKKLKRLEALKKKQEQINAQVQMLEATEKSHERKRETRRKILVGAYYLDQARKDEKFDEVVDLMENYLNRNSDRVLFDLKPIESKKTETVNVG